MWPSFFLQNLCWKRCCGSACGCCYLSEEAEKEEMMGLCGLAKDGEDLSEG